MQKFIAIGRLTKDVEVKYSQGEGSTAIARFTLAVDRKFKKDGEQSADFINCIAFGKTAEFVEKYFFKGSKIVIVGRITTGSYTNKDAVKVYTTEVTVEEVEFAESKGDGGATTSVPKNTKGEINKVDDSISDDELPFS